MYRCTVYTQDDYNDNFINEFLSFIFYRRLDNLHKFIEKKERRKKNWLN